MVNKSVGDCSISLKFVTQFDYATADLRQTFKVIGSKIKVTAYKRHLNAKLLHYYRKSGSLYLLAMSEFFSEAAK